MERLNDRFRIASRDAEQRQRRAVRCAPALLPFWSVATLTPIIRANSACDAPSFARTAWTSVGSTWSSVRTGECHDESHPPGARWRGARETQCPSVEFLSNRLRERADLQGRQVALLDLGVDVEHVKHVLTWGSE